MNRFKIQDSFAVEPDMFVFAGQIVEGSAIAGMKFRVPEAGHAWELVIRSVEFIRKAGGGEMIAVIAILSGAGVVALGILVSAWNSASAARQQADLKRDMLARGLSVQEIEQLTMSESAREAQLLDSTFPERVLEEAQAPDLTDVELKRKLAGFEEKQKGSLEPGKLADLVVLSRDILADRERDHIAETVVVLTMVGGKVVYEKEK